MEGNGVRIGKIAAVLLIATLIIAGLVYIQPQTGEAKMSDQIDDGGYTWCDSISPDPKVKYEWIDAKAGGTEFTELDTTSKVAYLPLTFTFPYYGDDLTEIWVTPYGYLTLEEIYSPNTGYSSNLPNSYGDGGQIAAGWSSAYDYYTTGGVYGGVHYYFSPLNDFVCIQWDKNSVGQTFEIILYSSGLIKLQWQNLGSSDYYKDGYYLVAGIESPDESTGLCYSRYSQANLVNLLAVEFSTNVTEIEDIALVNGDGDGHICYAEYDSYEFSALITTPAGSADVSVGSARVTFGNYTIPETLGPIGAEYKVVGGSSQFDLLPGSGQFIAVDEFIIDAYNLTHAKLRIKVTFFFEFPETGNLSMTVWARGKYSLPDIDTFEDVLYLDNMVTFEGSLKILGFNDREIKPKEYTRENETINITGLRLIYEKSFEGIYPRNESYYFMVRDEVGTQFIQRNTSGRVLFFKISMPLEAVKKTFSLIMLGIPIKNFIGELPEFWLLVDNTPPPTPLTMTIRADSRIDPQILVDNDDTLFVSWSTVNDIGSGVAKYRIYTSYEPGDEDVPWVDAKTTQYVWEGTTVGVFTLLVWAEDFVGHAGSPNKKSITIDKDPPSFSEFNIQENVWIKTLTPDVTIWVKDNLSKGEESATMVWAESIEYAVSTNGTENFREWISADVLDNEYSILVKIKPTFEEGMDNWIKFRAKDVAGNGPVESKMYRLWIDVTEVAFSDVFPTQNVWHKLNDVITKEVEVTLTDSTSWVDVSQIWYRIAITKDEDGNPIWKTGIDQEGNWVRYSVRPTDKVSGDDSQIHVHFKYTEFLEGEDNIIQFRTNDRAGNGRTDGWTLSPYYSLKINTRPTAVISKPLDGAEFYVDELIELDASGSKDIDVDKDNLDFQWYEGNRFLGEGKVLPNQRFSTLGDHYITLYVGDSGHELDLKTGIDTRANMTIVVKIKDIIYDPTKDSDEDGMDDAFEHMYMLDPFDKSDANIDYDHDGFSNLEEYLGTREDPGPFDPRDPLSYPRSIEKPPTQDGEKAPFSIAMFIGVIFLAVLAAAIIVIVSFIRMNRKEDREKREETEEEAMLVTPQLDIPTMPVMPMVDTSVPTLPAAGATEGQEALPPAPEEMVQPADGQPIPSMPPTGENPFGNAPIQ